jgi:hypothetical protein
MGYLRNLGRRWFCQFLALGFIALASASPALAVPTGNTPWAIVLCRFTDRTYAPMPHTQQWLSDFFTDTGIGLGDGMYAYWAQASLGQINLRGTALFGPYDLPKTIVLTNTIGRAEVWNACVKKARSQGADFSPFYGILVVPNQQMDEGATGTPGQVLISVGFEVSFTAHEMGHAYGLDHSYDTLMCTLVGQPTGEACDPYDIMSNGNPPSQGGRKSFPGIFGSTGPSLSAAYLGLIGWMPAERVYTYNPAGHPTEITLAPLETPQDSQYLMAKIPIGADPLHYYTVEFRHSRGLDSGMKDKIVLIHEVRQEHHGAEYLQYHPFLVDSNPDTGQYVSPEWTDPNSSFIDRSNNVHITVVSTGETATINLGHADDAPVPVFPPNPPTNLRFGRSGISTQVYPGFIDIVWDEGTPLGNLGKYKILVTGTLNQTTLVTTQFEQPASSGPAFHYISQYINRGTTWTFWVQACWHNDVCSPWPTQLTMTNPTGGSSGGSSGGAGDIRVPGPKCGTPGNLPCGLACGGRHNPCPLHLPTHQ